MSDISITTSSNGQGQGNTNPNPKLEKVKAAKIKPLTTLTDAELEPILTACTAEVEEYCNTKFTPTTATCRRDYSAQITPPKQPLISVQSIIVNTTSLAQDTDFYADIEQGFIQIWKSFDSVNRNGVNINYTYGYAEMPATVESVIMDLMKFTVESRQTDGNKESEDFAGEYTYTSKKAMERAKERDSILKRLEKYIEPEVVQSTRTDNKVKAMIL